MCETTVLIEKNLHRGLRSTIAKLLCGILPIELEVGRHVDLKPEQKICKLCKKQLVEDEMHFILCCGKFKDMRDNILKPLLVFNPETSNMSNHVNLSWIISKPILVESAPIIDAMVKERQNIAYESKGV